MLKKRATYSDLVMNPFTTCFLVLIERDGEAPPAFEPQHNPRSAGQVGLAKQGSPICHGHRPA